MKVKIAPSILASDFSRLAETVKRLDTSGADYIHCDVMDGNFVPPITFGAQAVRAMRPHTRLPLDCHLMVTRPETRVEEFVEAGADIITVHAEAAGGLLETLRHIQSFGVKAGAVVSPATPVEELFPACEIADMVLIMSVVPGWGGQKFIPESLAKIEKLRNHCVKIGRPELDIEVDGGITEANVRDVISAGANVIVAGSTVFRAPDMAAAISSMK